MISQKKDVILISSQRGVFYESKLSRAVLRVESRYDDKEANVFTGILKLISGS